MLVLTNKSFIAFLCSQRDSISALLNYKEIRKGKPSRLFSSIFFMQLLITVSRSAALRALLEKEIKRKNISHKGETDVS